MDYNLVIGATSSLGVILCRKLASNNKNIIISSRDKNDLENLKSDLEVRYNINVEIINHDFLDKEFDFSKYSKIKFEDVYLLSGFMGNGDIYDNINIENINLVNYEVPAKILLDIAKNHKQNNVKKIAIISSVAGDRGRQSNFLYGSAKAALTCFASGLRNKLYKDNIHVMTVKPGFIDTPLTFNLNSPLIASREQVVENIIKSLQKNKDVIYTPFIWRYIMLIIKNIPEKIFKKLSL